MILKGSQRAGGAQLAAHLLNARDNDHVRVGSIRGFVSDELHGAFKEAQAIASGTHCKQYLFSLSLNPPKDAKPSELDFERAADEAEKRLGLEGQPRAIIYHEKDGRRHAHVVWSRIDPQSMRAVNMAHFKTKLTALSRELYLDHGWKLPDGLRPDTARNPFNFTLDEWQRAKRQNIDPREIKAVFRDAWNRSDSRTAFANALAESGYFLARGDRRGFVALDVHGEVYAVAKWAGLKTAQVRERFGPAETLPSVGEVSNELKHLVTGQMKSFIQTLKDRQAQERSEIDRRRIVLRDRHRAERSRLETKQKERWQTETAARAARLRNGLAGLLDTLTGKARAIKDQNRAEAFEGLRRDQQQRDALILEQWRERHGLQIQIDALRHQQSKERKILARDVVAAMRRDALHHHASGQKPPPAPWLEHQRRRSGLSLDR